MSTEIRIPKLGISMEEATLVEWLVADGADVVEGQLLYSLETDKSVQEVESPAGGKLRIIGQVGEIYPVGELIAALD
ncbi:dihydrolipoamide acyltransferase [Sandaracinobacter sp. RS1-74]|uniref:biotin/lipoyl-containing protein n=1 Tax=Sandaracinobacteroides sayramensis TaxID=2913411 RepID=UPI001EDAD510|nr:biotin/lipoyl-containing protein [Sandaracinobacteroides sayramensis]MCG2840555.1 dihydrolipoamide acyltransferase [Sandaracinobacteroides sayramensis]